MVPGKAINASQITCALELEREGKHRQKHADGELETLRIGVAISRVPKGTPASPPTRTGQTSVRLNVRHIG